MSETRKPGPLERREIDEVPHLALRCAKVAERCAITHELISLLMDKLNERRAISPVELMHETVAAIVEHAKNEEGSDEVIATRLRIAAPELMKAVAGKDIELGAMAINELSVLLLLREQRAKGAA